ncbi:hypothetical protein AAF712_005752 [Marasmius tenuissimus]|uniref:Cation/H+ exchanger transmembrane domain-containing protein n=1 Tax=Marasmius tenuissimus TaxID=585030 RepID=A0ABR3A3P2_9AGAR
MHLVVMVLCLTVLFKLYINEVLLGTTFGIIIGPNVANLIDPRSWGAQEKITLEVMRVVLATGLFIIGVELNNRDRRGPGLPPTKYLWRHAKGLLVMIVPTMAIGWVLIAGFLKALFRQLDFISCLAISACLTPTDPIISAAIVGGSFAVRYVPLNIRQLISAESAANDGLAYPFLTIALYLTLESSVGVAMEKWILIGCLYQVVFGVIFGSVLGLAFSFLMKLSLKRGYVDKESYLALLLALALLTMGIATTIGTDDLLASFAAGSAVSWDGDFNRHIENEAFATIIDFVLNSACFIYIGAWLPFRDFNSEVLGIDLWRLFVLFVAVAFLRRIPASLVLYKWIPEVQNWKEAMFCGHFDSLIYLPGPMGVGAVFVSSLALTKLPKPQDPPQSQAEVLAATIQPIVSFVVLGSILFHGLSVVILSLTLGWRSRSRTLVSPHKADVQGLGLPIASVRPDTINTLQGTPGLGAVDNSSRFQMMAMRRNPSKQGTQSDDEIASTLKAVRSDAESQSGPVSTGLSGVTTRTSTSIDPH